RLRAARHAHAVRPGPARLSREAREAPVTLRIAAAAALILGLTTLLLYLHGIGKGPWAGPAARNLRRMKERAWPPAATEPFTIAAMTALPRWAGLSVYAPIERRGVAVEGYVQRMVRAGTTTSTWTSPPRPGGPKARSSLSSPPR